MNLPPMEFGKKYVVVFCKGCGGGYRVRGEAASERRFLDVREPEIHTCPSCGHTAQYLPTEIRIARFQRQGLGRHKRPAQ